MRLMRGDTLIEVLLAVTVFSMLSVGTMTIMNQGTNTAQRSLEITLVRQQIDAQAEAVRATQQAASAGYPAAWDEITSIDPPLTPIDLSSTCPRTRADVPNSFVMDARNAKPYISATMADINSSSSVPYAQVDYPSGVPQPYGIWIEHKADDSVNLPDLHTFTVRACWRGAGLDRPMNIETVLRLYDPGS